METQGLRGSDCGTNRRLVQRRYFLFHDCRREVSTLRVSLRRSQAPGAVGLGFLIDSGTS